MPPPVCFLSYSREDLQEVTTIARVLKTYGLRIWQDLHDLGTGPSEVRIRNAIRTETAGLLFYSTHESVSSDFVKQVELAEAENAHRKDPSYFIVPVFRLSISDTDARLKDTLTMPVSGFNGVKVATVASPQAIREAAHKAAERILHRVVLQPCDPLPLGLSSKQAAPLDVSLDLDFTPMFSDGLPPVDDWNASFPRALDRVKSLLVARSLTRLRLRTFAHLSLGLLFGFVFRERTGFRLDIEQVTSGQEVAVWNTSEAAVTHPMSMTERPAQLGSRNLVIQLNLVAPDHASIAAYAAQSGLTYRLLLEVTPPAYPYLISGAYAVCLARDLADRIKKIHAQYGTNTVHLFAAVPLGLAIMIGYNLNACGSIQCYEFDNASRQYHPSCLLT